jgi:cytochrome c-type biogenesis protein CcmH
MFFSRLLPLLLLCLLASSALAQVQEVDRPSDDPAVEKRLAKLSHELRCLQCRNQTLADSPAGLAVDLRNEIRDQIKAGKSDEEIKAFLTQRYGDFILYKPRVSAMNYLLWFGPFVVLLGGLALLFYYIRRRHDSITEHSLSDDDRRRAEKLLASGKETA